MKASAIPDATGRRFSTPSKWWCSVNPYISCFVVSFGFAIAVAGCRGLPSQQKPPVTAALPPTASLEDVIAVVNRNNSQIRSFSTNSATLSGPGMPRLRATIAVERPRQFRLRAETGLTGPEIDLGSNPGLFWFWVRRNEPRGLYYCSHETYAQTPVPMPIPISPEWLIEAFGVTELDPALAYQGPFRRGDGRVELRAVRETSRGPATTLTVIDPQYGLIVEQHVYDAQGGHVASALASRYRRDPLSGLMMPRTVNVRCPCAEFAMDVDLGNFTINQLPQDAQRLWAMPRFDGYPEVDLASLATRRE